MTEKPTQRKWKKDDEEETELDERDKLFESKLDHYTIILTCIEKLAKDIQHYNAPPKNKQKRAVTAS